MSNGDLDAISTLKFARQALRSGNRKEARRWAQQAVSLQPDNEEAWLILASLASPKASISYLKKALEVNPKSQNARQGMHWAIHRLRKSDSASKSRLRRKPILNPIPSEALVASRPMPAPLILVAI